MKDLIILGSTGSIGRAALDVARRLPDKIRIIGLVARTRADLLKEQIDEFEPRMAALEDETAFSTLKENPASWIRASSQRHMEQTYSKWSQGGVYGYGYQWWHGQFKSPTGDYTAITGAGRGGQRLFVVPQHKLVLTIFAGNYDTGYWRVSESILALVMAALP